MPHPKRVMAVLCVVGLLAVSRLAAQQYRALLDIGPGSLNPDDPFTTTFSMRAGAGWILDHHNALGLEYTRQSASRTTNADFGRYARQFLGVAWRHAFSEVYFDEEKLKQQYLLSVSAGRVIRNKPSDSNVDPDDGFFLGAGLAIRYPFTTRMAAMCTLEDDVALLPGQLVTASSGSYHIPSSLQHNFGVFILFQWRP
jgi:hypothetical protein